ncbi:hypothetical protein [Streptomyces nojiriensis]|uniref:hypothetical protein n=1 Tax=Streptomyces nojiriensis TaxID=66374 RepID=UPI003675D807
MASLFKPCDGAKPTRCPHAYSIRFREALGKQNEETGFRVQDDAIGRLAALYREAKNTAPSVTEARRASGQNPVEEYAATLLLRQCKMTGYSIAQHMGSCIGLHAALTSRKLNSVTPGVVG